MGTDNEQVLYRVLDKLDAHERHMNERLTKLEQELFFYKRMIRWIQTAGAVLIAIATLKFGDIRSLFK